MARKLKLQMQISIDGFVAGPNGEMDWMTFNWDDELKNCIAEITEPVDCIVLGANLAKGFIPTWTSRLEEAAEDDFARKMVETSKIVFSKTLEEDGQWLNTTVNRGDVAAEITSIKEQTGGDIIVYGGGSFVGSLTKERLIDEYNIFVNPVALGKGLPIFNQLENYLNLSLVKSQAFDCGIVLLRYEAK